MEKELGKLGSLIGQDQARLANLKERLTTLSKLDEYRDFNDIHWQAAANAVAQLLDEKKRLESASDILQQLTEQLAKLRVELAEAEFKLTKRVQSRGEISVRLELAKTLQQQATDLLNQPGLPTHAIFFERLDTIRQDTSGELQLTVESCDPRERELRDWLQNKLESEQGKQNRLRDKIIAAMTEYKKEFKLETEEVDANIDALFEYEAMLNQLAADDLPRFEARFKELLNENTIREVANF